MQRVKEAISFLRSFRLRLFFIILMVGIIPCILIRQAIIDTYEERAIDVKTSEAETQVKIIANHLLTYDYLNNPESEIINAELSQISNLYSGRVIIINEAFTAIKDTYGISEGKTIISEDVIRCFKGQNTVHYNRDYHYLELTVPITEVISKHRDDGTIYTESSLKGVMLVSVSTDTIARTLDHMKRESRILLFTVMMIIIAVTIILAYLLNRPFVHVTQSIAEYKEGYSEEEIHVPAYLETERITDAFNQLQRRMKVLDDSRQEFVSNVSHELKTPITSMKVLAESLLAQDNVPSELYREFMQDISQEIDREDKIINDLLALVKLDKTAAQLNITTVDINQLVDSVLKRLRPIAVKEQVEIVYESIRPVTAQIDEMKISLAITNLVENAIKYNHEKGWVKVVLDANHQYFTLTVSDSGIGISEEDLDHIYERFFRVDKSRSREVGGTGLGLAITRNCVLLHRGIIKADSTPGEGTTFTMRIPISRVG